MALRRCQECTTTFAVGLLACPHCQSTDHEEDGAMSPKITRHGGPTIAGASVVAGGWSNEGDPDLWPEPTVEAEDSSEEQSPEALPEPDYEDMTVEQLKEQLAARDLPKSGKRDELVQRLRDDDTAGTE